MQHDSKIYVAGHRGLVGSALMRQLKTNGYRNFVTRTHAELDLTDQTAVRDFFCGGKAGICFSCSSQGRRHPCQQHLSRRIYFLESGHSDQRHP